MNKLLSTAVVALGAVLLAACGSGSGGAEGAPAAGQTAPIAVGEPSPSASLGFEILWQNAFTAIDDERTVVLSDTAAFEALWNEGHRNLSSLHPPPKIDFSRKVVVGVFTGKQQNGCRSVTISRTALADGKLAVEYDLGRLVTIALCKPEFTSPGVLAVLDRSDAQASAKVQFTRIEPQPLVNSRIALSLSPAVADRQPTTVVVKDAAAWTQLWTRYSLPGTPLPPVDFSKSMVLFAFYGVDSGCDGNQLEDVSRVNGKLYVTSTYTPPGPAVLCIAAFTARGAAVTVDRSDEPVVFISKRLPAPTI